MKRYTRLGRWIVLLTLFSFRAPGQTTHELSLVAGIPQISGATDGSTFAPRFNQPRGLARDAAGNLYIADTGSNTLRLLSPELASYTLAGSPAQTGAVNGAGADARFNAPEGLAIDPSGNILLADTQNHTVRRITPAGIVTTLAGVAGLPGATDGNAATARFNRPRSLLVLGSGAILVADSSNHAVRHISSSGIVTTWAGAPGNAGYNDGVGTAAAFRLPTGLTHDAAGNVYVADTDNHLIRRISPDRIVTTVAGVPGAANLINGASTVAQFRSPQSLAVGTDGYLYVADVGNHAIRRISLETGSVATVAGGIGGERALDGAGTAARLQSPESIISLPDGNLLFLDTGSSTLRRVTPAGEVSTIAGTAGRTGSEDGTGNAGTFNTPYGIARDAIGNLYVADTFNHLVRLVSKSGGLTTVAGKAETPGTADGSGANARFYFPTGIAAGPDGAVFVTDSASGTIRRVSREGTVSTFAGSAFALGSADGIGPQARFLSPYGIAAAPDGSLFVADTGNHLIRRISPAGEVKTIAGAAGRPGFVNGSGAQSLFNGPTGVAVGTEGEIYVADSLNRAIRRISPTGEVSTQLASGLTFPYSLAIATSGELAVAEYSANFIRIVSPSGFISIGGIFGYQEGAGATVRFNEPTGLLFEPDGGLIIVDSSNHVLRRATRSGVPVFIANPKSQTVPAGTDVSLSAVARSTPAASLQWLFNSTPIPGATDASLRLRNIQFTGAGNYSVQATSNGQIATSAPAVITVLATPPSISIHPQEVAVVTGSDFSISVTATGSEPLTYEWRRNGQPITGGTNRILSRFLVGPGDAGMYDVIVRNSVSSAESRGALVVVAEKLPPVIVRGPEGRTVPTGGSALLEVEVAGTPPFSYIWRKNGALVPGASAARLVLSQLQRNDGGFFSVQVSNSAGSVSSAAAIVSVASAPGLLAQPRSQEISANQPLELTVTAAGVGPFTFQWYRNYLPIQGATNSTYRIASVAPADEGLFSVAVGNSLGRIESAPAAVRVIGSGFTGQQLSTSGSYPPGGYVTITASITYSGTPEHLGWQVILPTGWALATDSATSGVIGPAAGQTEVLEWSWPQLPPSPFTLTYTLRVPPGETGDKSVSALLAVRQGQQLFQVLSRPDPLVLRSTGNGTHSADSNRDGRISLLELTRVIELYNYRSGAERTGQYRQQPATEDGFSPGP